MHASLSIATVGLAAVAAAAPARSSSGLVAFAKRAVSDTYTFYTGNGSPAQGWPDFGNWGTYEELWATNSPVMAQSCEWNGWGANDSPEEIAAIDSAIQQVSGETGVDARFILAIVMQESIGCVRAPTTDNGVRNPGLMQSHNGDGDCAGVNPCPAEEILQMIRDGTAGTASGDGLQQTIAAAAAATGDTGVRSYYAGARLYNSGSADYENLNNGITATPCYVTNVANRLTGWVLAPEQCPL
ncbi:hypothetical protein NLU13_1289 [Sarocladium strictum]|uniref:Uncharacterized protein n=1 Tax=Sarocladium strictum TaxID=5046 RepID=A0AA39LC83_SARSR|nr:hypothetical protein NLU13_1289 [Sarocladium strictum]